MTKTAKGGVNGGVVRTRKKIGSYFVEILHVDVFSYTVPLSRNLSPAAAYRNIVIWGYSQGVWGRKSPNGVQGPSPCREQVPEKLKQLFTDFDKQKR